MQLETSLGDDVLLLQGFTGSEAISRMFQFHLDLLSEIARSPFQTLLGNRVMVRVSLASGDERFFNGFVSRFAQSGSDARFTYYQMELFPALVSDA